MAGKAGKHDPTRAKPLLILIWLRVTIERMVKRKAIEEIQLINISDKVREVGTEWRKQGRLQET